MILRLLARQRAQRAGRGTIQKLGGILEQAIQTPDPNGWEWLVGDLFSASGAFIPTCLAIGGNPAG